MIDNHALMPECLEINDLVLLWASTDTMGAVFKMQRQGYRRMSFNRWNDQGLSMGLQMA